MVELIAVMGVMGVLASFAVVRLQQPSAHYLTLATDQLGRNLSHVQMLAVSQSRRLKLNADGNRYEVQACESAACASPIAITDPATGRPFIVALENGTRIDSQAPLFIDSLGRPSSATGVITADPAARFQLSLGGRTTQVDLAPLTGHVRITY